MIINIPLYKLSIDSFLNPEDFFTFSFGKKPVLSSKDFYMIKLKSD